jgi:hypothetical protein
MSQLLAPSRIGRCPAASRSYLPGPDGPAEPPPGHRLRSGGYMAATRSGTKGKISRLDVSTLSGEPRTHGLSNGGQSRSQGVTWGGGGGVLAAPCRLCAGMIS